MNKFNVGVSANLLRPDGTQTISEVDLTPLTGNPSINVTSLPEIDTGNLASEDLDHLDAAILFLERITENSFSANSRLSLLARYGVGYDTVDIPACTNAGVAVAIAPSGVKRPVATTVVGLLLALTLNLKVKDKITRDVPHGWATKNQYNGMGLVGRTLGGIGLGNIGSEVFKLMQPFDMRMIAHDPHIDQSVADEYGVELVALDEVFRQSDVVTVNCLLNESTHHIVNRERLALMQPHAYLINTARGPVVDEQALIDALQSGQLKGAGLDVFAEEPPRADNPLLSMDNVLLSPHALCFTDQCMAGLGAADVNACLAMMNGTAPESLVDPDVLKSPRLQSRLQHYRECFT